MPVRAQRLVPMGTGAVIMLIGVGVLAVAGAPAMLTGWLGAIAALVVALTTVTAWWKISAHTAMVAGTAVLLTAVAGPVAVLGWPLVAVTGWSRLRLRAHTVPQVLAGGALGAAGTALCVAILIR